MSTSPFSDREKNRILQKGCDRTSVKKVCEQYGISIRTFYRWQAMVAQQQETRTAQLRNLEQENQRLKQKFAELSLDYQALRVALVAEVKNEC